MKFLSNLTKHHKKTSVYNHEFHVLRIWMLVLGLFFVGLIISTIIHVFIFMRVDEGQLFGLEIPEETGSEIVSASLINETADTLKHRRAEFTAVGAETMPVDPS